MKHIFFILLLLPALLNAQQKPKNFCPKSTHLTDCSLPILNTIGGYEYSYTDTVDNSHIAIVYKNNDKEYIAFMYQRTIEGADPELKTTGTVYYNLKMLKAQFLTLYKIYTGYYGREITMEKLKASEDYWRFIAEGKTYNISAEKASESGYWKLSF